MTKKIYLCGPIMDVPGSEANAWRQKVIRKLSIPPGRDEMPDLKNWNEFICLDPMRRQFKDGDEFGANEIVQWDLEDVNSADLLIVNYNKARPETTFCGTSMEVWEAHKQNKFIIAFSDMKNISPWMRVCCTRICKNVDEAIAYVKKHF